jgi:hypothetical protein
MASQGFAATVKFLVTGRQLEIYIPRHLLHQLPAFPLHLNLSRLRKLPDVVTIFLSGSMQRLITLSWQPIGG